MSQYVDGNCKTYECDEALAQYRHVKMDADGKVTYADATDESDGTTETATFAAGELVSVRLASAAGTQKMVASAAVTAGALVYGAADGKVASTGFVLRGKAMEAASGDGSVIEVMPFRETGLHTVQTVAAAGSVQGDAAALTGVRNVVTGGNDTTGVVLPSAVAGLGPIYILNSGSAGLKVYPASGDKLNNGSANAAIAILENTQAILTCTAADNWAMSYTVNA